MCVDIEEIVVVLDHYAIYIKYRVVMFILVNGNIKMLSKKIVSLLLCATSLRSAIRHLMLLKKPNINITA